MGGRGLILLDTHVLLWLRSGDARLGPRARKVIARAESEGEVAVSAISFWEVAMLKDKRRIELDESVSSWRRKLLDEGIVEIAINGDIGIRAVRLRDFHADPADRLIVATALAGHQLVTADLRILNWSGALNRLRAKD